MLILTKRIGEAVIISDEISVTMLSIDLRAHQTK